MRRAKLCLQAAAALLVVSAAAALGLPCAAPRPLAPTETSFLADQVRALSEALPPPPSGWARLISRATASRGPLCDDPGYRPPLWARIDATDLPAGSPELTFASRLAASDDYERRVAAAQSGSKARGAGSKGNGAENESARIPRDLQLHPVPTPSPLEKSARRLNLTIHVNASSFTRCGRGAPMDVAGATFAFRASATTCRSRLGGDVLSIGFGDWAARAGTAGDGFLAGFNRWPGPPPERAAVHTVLIEIAGDAEAVDAVGRVLDTNRLAGLLRR